MFGDYNRPFYCSASTIDLEAISLEKYKTFVTSLFSQFGKEIEAKCIEEVYRFVGGNTRYMQWIFRLTFELTSSEGVAAGNVVEKALTQVLEINGRYFRELLSQINTSQKSLLYALVQETGAKSILSSEFVRGHYLKSSSSVQYAARRLLQSGLITQSEGVYTVSDPLLAMWIGRNILWVNY